MKAMKAEKLEAIQAKEKEKQQVIQAKETHKQQSIQAKETEKQQAIQAKEIEKQQAIRAMESIIHAKGGNGISTIFSPDRCFSLLKKRYRGMKLGCLSDIVSVVNQSASIHITQPTAGTRLVTTYIQLARILFDLLYEGFWHHQGLQCFYLFLQYTYTYIQPWNTCTYMHRV